MAADASDFHVRGILLPRAPLGIGPWGGLPARRGRRVGQRFVGPLVVVPAPKGASKRCCCARDVDAAGRVVSRLSSRCIRSWGPFSCGLAGAMR